MIRIIGSSHYFYADHEGTPLPDLHEALRPLCNESYRRIDRFIQLSLLGSARCTQGKAVSPDCGLYISTGIGPVKNNIFVQETLFRDLQLPKPFHFVNTLGSSAGYYVCKNLGLKGPSLFISRRGSALEAALMLATVDLRMGIVRQALVGAVEESTMPLGDHRRRLGLAAAPFVAEGSHWLLLEQSTGTEPGASIDTRSFDHQEGLQAFLDGEKFDRVVGLKPQPADQGFHDSLNAAAVTEFLKMNSGGRLALVSANHVHVIQK